MKNKIVWGIVQSLIFGVFILLGQTINNTFISGWWSCLFAMLIVNTIEKQQKL